ncbi:YitT family protein [Agromyces sp. NPDC060279]|uniref:YczE/YyaS/YitT family protein n=1 Tax=Agromyces sp. NPDC060279 TaxID=3347092 RepID=UPI0036648C17
MGHATAQDAGIIDNGSLVRRWITYIVGIYVLTLGVSLAIRAGIGVSPQSSLTRTMTLIFPGVSQGTFNFALEILMLILAFLVMPKGFKWRNLLSLIPSAILAFLLDVNLSLTEWVMPEPYLAKLALLLFADALLALGLFMMIRANLVLMPIDLFVNTLHLKTGRKWGNLKTIFDCCLLITSAGIGLLFLGAPQFIREGTILNAIFVGQYIKLYTWIFMKLSGRRAVAADRDTVVEAERSADSPS